MKREEQSSQTERDKTIIKLLQVRDGRDGRDGVKGIKGDIGERGEKGDQGKVGQKGEPSGGVVYVRWGHDSCPTTGAQLIYSGRAGGPDHNNKGGGSGVARPGPTRACALPSTFQALPSRESKSHVIL